jgi:phosphatidylserine decarboxylase
MVRDGIPFVVVPVIIAVIFGWLGIWPVAVVFAAVAVFMVYFFRDPLRDVPTGAGLIVSAADGHVTRIENMDEGKLVSVFLSPLDVHINRSPIAGKIIRITYVEGKRIPATSDTTSLVNERNSLVIEGEDVTVTCTQIAGILARRIVCWPRTGDNLRKGEKFGMIKFGSRTDLLVPANVEIAVSVGDKVKGGETIIGRLKVESQELSPKN